jgi:hypothetical protein
VVPAAVANRMAQDWMTWTTRLYHHYIYPVNWAFDEPSSVFRVPRNVELYLLLSAPLPRCNREEIGVHRSGDLD